MAKFADRVKVGNTTAANAGSATTLTLGSAEAGYQAVPSSLNGETIRYVIEEGNTWEIGTGTYTHSGTTLTRSVTSSSNSNNAIAVTTSSKVFIAPVVDDLQFVQVYSSTSDLPSASSNHGRITHVHGEGAMYFAHGGNWIKLANASDAISLTDLSVTQNAASGSGALSYNNSSGVFSYTPPASTSASGGTLEPVKETEFTATANQTTFTVTYAVGNIAVFLNGSKLGATDFTATNGTSVVLATGATLNDLVEVVEYGAPFASPYSSSIHTATANQTSLTVAYTVGKVAVYVNGVKYLVGTDVTATNGTSLTFTSALSAGDKIEVVEHGALADAASAFTDLTDTPSSLGTAGQIVQVNSAANALEFADAASGGDSLGTVSSNTLDLSTGNFFNVALSADTTLSFSNAPTVHQFTLRLTGGAASGGFDLVNTSYVGNIDTDGLTGTNPRGVQISGDNKFLYLVDGSATDYIHQFELADGGLSGGKTAARFRIGDLDGTPYGCNFSPDGYKMFAFGGGNDTIYSYTLYQPFQIATAVYDGSSSDLNISATNTTPRCISFNSDGSKMYVTGNGTRDVAQYSLSTAYRPSTGSYDNVTRDLRSGFSHTESSPTAFYWNDDGSKAYMGGYATDQIYELNCSTSYDISSSSMTYNSVTFDPPKNDNLYSFVFSKGGHYLYISDSGTTASPRGVNIYRTAVHPYTVTYPSSVKWSRGGPPFAPEKGEVDTLHFSTTDGGTTYYATRLGDRHW